ncbi:hypothetical protein AcetOrient_orf01806 [Acetobacter orientalis]|uniref:Uncharacterized protein n=1 Tax=Acetobacter orientalis TaxID=146474 RepID=A0A2Z5ZG54_9PROT|nr:hypothetical protein AcetOrient_orf01806 [Acetobacter orientalis]
MRTPRRTHSSLNALLDILDRQNEQSNSQCGQQCPIVV